MLGKFLILALVAGVFSNKEHEELMKSLEKSGKVDAKLLSNLRFEPMRKSNIFVSFNNGDTTPVLNQIKESFGPDTSRTDMAQAVMSGLQAFSLSSQGSTLEFLKSYSAAFTKSETFWINNQLYIKEASGPLVNALSRQQNIASIKEEGKVHLIDSVVRAGDEEKQWWGGGSDEEDEEGGSTTSSSTRRPRSTRRSTTQRSSSTTDNENDDVEENSTSRTRSTRRPRSTRRSTTQRSTSTTDYENDDDDEEEEPTTASTSRTRRPRSSTTSTQRTTQRTTSSTTPEDDDEVYDDDEEHNTSTTRSTTRRSSSTTQSSSTLTYGVRKINAPAYWQNNITGEGIIVSVIDTGTMLEHESLSSNYVGAENNGWYDATYVEVPFPWWPPRKETPYDDQGHGTHCTGTVCGTTHIGVAPGARWMACKALNAAGSGTQDGLLKCMQFSLCPTDYEGENADCSKAPHIVSNSWGSNDDEVAPEYEKAIDAWISAGIIPIFAAGNSGKECETMGSPGASKNVISVGATDDQDNIADFSSRGPVKKNRLMKPEVSAPGVDVESASHRNAKQYTKMSGTSMACPHVAGLAALLMQDTIRQTGQRMNFKDMRDAMQSYSVRHAMKRNGQSCGDKKDDEWPNNVYGHGRVDSIKLMERDNRG